MEIVQFLFMVIEMEENMKCLRHLGIGVGADALDGDSLHA